MEPFDRVHPVVLRGDFVSSCWFRAGLFFRGECLDGFGGSHLAPPRRERTFVLMFLAFEQSEGEVAQGGHHMRLLALGDSGGVFVHANVAPVVGAIFYRVPVSAYFFEQDSFI